MDKTKSNLFTRIKNFFANFFKKLRRFFVKAWFIFLEEIKKPFALIVGSEAHGVSKLLKENCTTILALPMIGQIESLNAAVSLSVALYTLTFNN